MTKHDYIAMTRRGYEAWSRGDIESVIELVNSDFTWSDPPEVVGGRGGSGRSEFELYLRSFSEAWDDFSCQPESFDLSGDELVVTVREQGKGKLSGARVEHRLVHVWRFEGGRARSLRAFVETGAAMRRIHSVSEPLAAGSAVSWQPA